MANPLRMLNRAAPSRSPEREALAQAIERHNDAVSNLAAMTKAVGEASSAAAAAERAVVAATEAVETAKQNAVVHLTARMLGEGNDAPTSVRDARDELQNAQDDATAANEVAAALQSRLKVCEDELRWAKKGVQDKITDVVRAEGSVRKLLSDYRSRQQELERRRQVLLWLEGRPCSVPGEGLIPHELRHWDVTTLDEIVSDGLPDGAGAWAAAFERLASDADAPLPAV